MDERLRELTFVNSDAAENSITVYVATSSIPRIAEWYGSHYAGDRYMLCVDGERLRLDHNGGLTKSAAKSLSNKDTQPRKQAMAIKEEA